MITLFVIIISTIVNVIKILSPFAVYILFGISLMKIAKLENVKFSWFSWIPIANSYLTGKISDKIALDNGKTRKNRLFLLWLEISNISIVVLSFFIIFGGIINAIMTIINIITTGTIDLGSIASLTSPIFTLIKQLISGTLTSVTGVLLPNIWMLIPACILLIGIEIASTVFVFISSYTMFKKYSMKYCKVFIIASIASYIVFDFAFVLPLFLLISIIKYKKELDNSINITSET